MNSAKAFLSPDGFAIEGLKFRDISFGDASLAWQIGIRMLGNPDGGKVDESEPSAPITEQIKRLLWQLHIPEGMTKDEAIEATLQAVDDGTWEKKVRTFSFKLSMGALEEMTKRLNGEAAQIEAAAVKVSDEENAGPDKKKAPSPTAEPASSGPSAEVA